MDSSASLLVILLSFSASSAIWLRPSTHDVTYRSRNSGRQLRHALEGNLEPFEQQGTYLSKRAYPGMEKCYFESFEDSPALAGDVFEPFTTTNKSHCTSTCLRQTSFYCAAALIRSRTCYLTGFRMRRDYWSTHFVRTCDDHVDCYKPMVGWSVVHSKEVSIPWFISTPEMRRYFCMAVCNHSLNCVGFDLKDHELGFRACFLSSLLEIDESLRFDVHLRRC